MSRCLPSVIGLVAALLLGAPLGVLRPGLAVETLDTENAPDLTSARAKIKAQDWPAAIAELEGLAQTREHADVYNLLGFSLRKSGDYARALTFYKKALDLDPDHKGAHEYLGELYLETGELAKAKEQLAILVRLCPEGCEERADLEKALASRAN